LRGGAPTRARPAVAACWREINVTPLVKILSLAYD
jgi:hypothetical protein